jgi:hypothetical protein
VVRIHSPRPNSLKDLQTPNNDIRVSKGSVFGPWPSPYVGLCWCCPRVLINLLCDDCDDLLGTDQEVW